MEEEWQMLMNTFPSDELVFMQKPGGNGFVHQSLLKSWFPSIFSPISVLHLIFHPLQVSALH